MPNSDQKVYVSDQQLLLVLERYRRHVSPEVFHDFMTKHDKLLMPIFRQYGYMRCMTTPRGTQQEFDGVISRAFPNALDLPPLQLQPAIEPEKTPAQPNPWERTLATSIADPIAGAWVTISLLANEVISRVSPYSLDPTRLADGAQFAGAAVNAAGAVAQAHVNRPLLEAHNTVAHKPIVHDEAKSIEHSEAKPMVHEEKSVVTEEKSGLVNDQREMHILPMKPRQTLSPEQKPYPEHVTDSVVQRSMQAWNWITKNAEPGNPVKNIFVDGRKIQGNEVTVIGHGNDPAAPHGLDGRFGAKFVELYGKDGKIMFASPEKLAEKLIEHGWKGGNIRLMSCNSGIRGRDGKIFAQELSDALYAKGAPSTVAAPLGAVQLVSPLGAERIKSLEQTQKMLRSYMNSLTGSSVEQRELKQILSGKVENIELELMRERVPRVSQPGVLGEEVPGNITPDVEKKGERELKNGGYEKHPSFRAMDNFHYFTPRQEAQKKSQPTQTQESQTPSSEKKKPGESDNRETPHVNTPRPMPTGTPRLTR